MLSADRVTFFVVGKFGYYLPWAVVGTILSAIGYGLLSLLSPSTPTAAWIGYQVLYGVGGGSATAAVSAPDLNPFEVCVSLHSALSQAYIAVQNLVPTPQIPTAMAIVVFCQNMGGAVSLVVANAIFSNILQKQLQQRAGEIGVAPDIIFNAGVRGFRKLISGDQLAAVLEAYSKSIDSVMYLGIAVSIVAFSFAWGMGWKDIRKEKELRTIEE